MTKINIEISEKYKEHLDLLKQIIPNMDGSQITDDTKMVEVLIETFIWFIQEQAMHEHNHDDGGWHCGTGWCGCSH